MKWKLKDFVEINPKESIKKGSVAKKIPMECLIPFSRDIQEWENATFSGGSKFRNGDTIMARITPCLENGKRAKVSILKKDEVGFGSTEYIVFRSIPNISDPDFVYYLICSDFVREPAIKSMVGSSGRQRVQTDVLQNLELDLPDVNCQKQIATILRALDDKISINTRINNNLEQQAQALFKSWFVENENPERKIIKAEDFFDISIGKTPPRKEQEWFSENQNNNVIWVSISDMGSCGTFISDSSEYLTKEAISKFNINLK